jgi:hypothetical protein
MPAPPPAAGPVQPALFRIFLIARATTAVWPWGGSISGHLFLERSGIVVSLSDEPAGNLDVSGLAEQAAQFWRGREGYRELSFSGARCLGFDSGLERRFEIRDAQGATAVWSQRCLVAGGRAFVALVPQEGGEVADLIGITEPFIPAPAYAGQAAGAARTGPPPYALPFVLTVPEGWRASERIVFTRAGAASPIVADNIPIPPLLTSADMAQQTFLRNYTQPGWAVTVKNHVTVLGFTDGATLTARAITGHVTRTWHLALGDRAYTVRATANARDRLLLGQFAAHFALRMV